MTQVTTMNTKTNSVRTAADRNAQNDYYLLLPETTLPDEVLWQLPGSLTLSTPNEDSDLGWDIELNVRPGEYRILSIDTETNELRSAKGGSVIHPEPPGEHTFSSATVTTFTNRHSFRSRKVLSGDTVFALDTACLALENTIGSQFTLDRRGE